MGGTGAITAGLRRAGRVAAPGRDTTVGRARGPGCGGRARVPSSEPLREEGARGCDSHGRLLSVLVGKRRRAARRHPVRVPTRVRHGQVRFADAGIWNRVGHNGRDGTVNEGAVVLCSSASSPNMTRSTCRSRRARLATGRSASEGRPHCGAAALSGGDIARPEEHILSQHGPDRSRTSTSSSGSRDRRGSRSTPAPAAPARAAAAPATAPAVPYTPVDFASLGVAAPLVEVLAAQGISMAFPIQAATLPDSLAGRDVLGRGRTGSGKTIAFASRWSPAWPPRRPAPGPSAPRSLVLVPTRELANQVAGRSSSRWPRARAADDDGLRRRRPEPAGAGARRRRRRRSSPAPAGSRT